MPRAATRHDEHEVPTMPRPQTILAALLVLSTATTGWTADFRIETKVYNGKGKAPVSLNTSLFEAGFVYDYLFLAGHESNPYQVAVFDQARGRFVLIDPARKIKAEVKTEDVRLFTEKWQSVAEKSSRPFMKFAAEPEFDVTFSEDGELSLSSDFITYRLQTVPAGATEGALQYREFSDWYARFNAMATPGSTPPFPRMAVNEELAKRSLIPTEVQLTIPAASGTKAVSLRSEHFVSWRLLPKDHKRIAETGHQLATFKLVDFDKFQEADQAKRVAAKPR
jgi:hypothetical protein